VGGRWCEVACHHGEGGFSIEVRGACSFAVSPDGGQITALGRGWESGDELSTQVLLGPALILALALRGTFALHASAVTITSKEHGGRAVAFLGPSGSGKSTLAAALPAPLSAPLSVPSPVPSPAPSPACSPEPREESSSLLGDDILPLRPRGGAPVVLPRFPQLKLARQPGVAHPPQIPLAALYLLAGESPAGAVARETLAPRERVLALVRHTVAARLFTPDLLVLHLDAMITVARAVPLRRLLHPWTPAALPAVARALREDLALDLLR